MAPGFLDDRWREGTEPQTPAEQTYFDIYHQCRIRLHAAQWFAVCFLDIDRHDEHIAQCSRTLKEIDVASMEDIEATVGKHNPLAGYLKMPNLICYVVEGINTSGHEPALKGLPS